MHNQTTSQISGYSYISGRPLSGIEPRIAGYRTVPYMHKTYMTDKNIFLLKGSPTCITSISSSICHGVGPLVDPFQSHVSRSLFKSLPWFLLPVGE
jgi:hypothetical protein